ncbi:hypothetical protein J2T49_001695 [Pseudomonas nitroreducens]|nr:hypothetical protein [Pseudomonas nitroreducens]MCP1685756.1 hypothetical protein [Pseudomonas nitroreducens]
MRKLRSNRWVSLRSTPSYVFVVQSRSYEELKKTLSRGVKTVAVEADKNKSPQKGQESP